jgi:hypothetical protein
MAQQAEAKIQTEPAPRKIRDLEFSQRLVKALDDNPYTHAVHHGRLSWVQRELVAKFGERGKVSLESVRKWVAGEVKPRDEFVAMLAEILEVDTAWLHLGVAPDLAPREQKLRNAAADGAVNLVCGLIQMNGGHPAFPEPKDVRAKKSHIDLYAIIKGAQYAFHVSLGAPSDAPGYMRFSVPNNSDAFMIGVAMVDDLTWRLVEITPDVIAERGVRKGGAIEVTLAPEMIDQAEITSFRNRL